MVFNLTALKAMHMHKEQISNMLWEMAEMVDAVHNGSRFVEISTYVKNHCPGIEPEFIEVFRDFLGKLQWEKFHKGKYSATLHVDGKAVFTKCGFNSHAEVEEFISAITNNGTYEGYWTSDYVG